MCLCKGRSKKQKLVLVVVLYLFRYNQNNRGKKSTFRDKLKLLFFIIVICTKQTQWYVYKVGSNTRLSICWFFIFRKFPWFDVCFLLCLLWTKLSFMFFLSHKLSMFALLVHNDANSQQWYWIDLLFVTSDTWKLFFLLFWKSDFKSCSNIHVTFWWISTVSGRKGDIHKLIIKLTKITPESVVISL